MTKKYFLNSTGLHFQKFIGSLMIAPAFWGVSTAATAKPICEVTIPNPARNTPNNASEVKNLINAHFTRMENECETGVINIRIFTDEDGDDHNIIKFDGPLNAKNNVTLNIGSGATLRLTRYIGNTPAFNLTGTDYSGMSGQGTFDVNGNAIYAIRGSNVNNVKIGNVHPGLPTVLTPSPIDNDRLTIKGWKYGILIENDGSLYNSGHVMTNATPSSYITLSNLNVIDPQVNIMDLQVFNQEDDTLNSSLPFSGVQYPIWINSRAFLPQISDLTIDGVIADGGYCTDGNGTEVSESCVKIGGAHQVVSGDDTYETILEHRYTADQISIHGVNGGTLNNVQSLNGGEVGITIARGSRNIDVTNTIAGSADGHGYNIGSSHHSIKLPGSAPTGLVRGMRVFGQASEARGTVATINDQYDDDDNSTTTNTVVWLNSVSGRFIVGENIAYGDLDIDGNLMPASPSPIILEVNRTSNINLNGNNGNNGNNEGINADGNGISRGRPDLVLSDYFIQQADQIELTNVRSNTSSIDYGLLVTSSDYTLTNFISGSDSLLPGTSTSATTNNSATNVADIYGTNFDDIYYGGYQMDTLRGRGGSDRLLGRAGNDTLLGGAGEDTLLGQEGDDTLSGGANDDILRGGSGLDNLIGGSGIDILHGEDGDDTLKGGPDRDTLLGGLGSDTLEGGPGDDILEGEQGDDDLSGGSGADVMKGGAGDDMLEGDQGDDTLDGGDGTNTIDGGLGIDTVSYKTAEQFSGYMIADLAQSNNNTKIAANDTYIMIENIEGSNYNDSLRGDNNSNSLYGLEGNDFLHGRGGDDTLTGGSGKDIFVFIANGGHNIITDFNTSDDSLSFNIGSTQPSCVAKSNVDNTAFYEWADSSVALSGVVCSNSIVVNP